MTHQPPQNQFSLGNESALAWAAARSQWLDAFADLELAICRCSFRQCGGPNKKSAAQRLNDLVIVKRSPHLPGKDEPTLRKLAEECQELKDIRATLVHSHMRLGTSDAVPVALFQNIADEARDLPNHVVMTFNQLKCSAAKVRQLAAELERFASPSSPPRPSPAEAAGP